MKKKKCNSMDTAILKSFGELATSKPKKGYLFFLAGPLLGKLFPLENGTTLLGSSKEADITIKDKGVSEKHVEITVKGNRVTIKDLGSTHGMFISGESIKSKVLENDDKIQISPKTIFKYSYTDAEEKLAFDAIYDLRYEQGYKDGVKAQKSKSKSKQKK